MDITNRIWIEYDLIHKTLDRHNLHQGNGWILTDTGFWIRPTENGIWSTMFRIKATNT